MKLLKLKTLLRLAGNVDLFSTEENFKYFSYPKLYWRLNRYSASSIRDGVGQLVKSGHVAKIMRNYRPNFRLTEVGKEELLLKFAVSRNKGRWDKTWRVVVIDSKRTSKSEVRWLRSQLKQFGCRNLERGVYVTPLNISKGIKDVLLRQSLLGGVTVLETKKFVVGDDKAFASIVWELDELVEAYLEFVSLSAKLIRVVRSGKELTDKLKREFVSVSDRWFELLSVDPGLPTGLLPKDWGFEEAKSNYLKLAESVWELEEEEAS